MVFAGKVRGHVSNLAQWAGWTGNLLCKTKPFLARKMRFFSEL
jgi:hypothetical protein